MDHELDLAFNRLTFVGNLETLFILRTVINHLVEHFTAP